jgi:plastocyanin
MKRFQILTMYVVAVAAVLGVAIGVTAWIRTSSRAATTTATTTTTTTAAEAASAPTPASSSRVVAAGEAQVKIEEFAFVPAKLTVAAGTKVTWVNDDDVPHTATSSDSPAAFDSKTLDTDGTYSFTFAQAGTYRYYCKVHPRMTATVVVK